MEFELTQFSDTGNYVRLAAAILALEPAAVVVSSTARGTRLMQVLEEVLQSNGLPEPFFVERRHFDETEGQNLLLEADVVGLQQPDYASKFVACAAFAAVWRFAQSSMELRMAPFAMRVTYRGATDSMLLDSNTAGLLELVADVRGRREKASVSVFGLFQCLTPGGARLLRQSLLMPPASKAEIQARQEAVGALLTSEELFQELQRLLPSIGDVDLLAARLTAEPKTRGPQWCKAAIRTALRLRQALAALPLLARALEAPSLKSSLLLTEAGNALSHERFPRILEELDRVFDQEGPVRQGGQGPMAHAALMYSVRSSASALLDVARQTWNDTMEQIHMLHRDYAVKYPEMDVRLEFTERHGWYLSHTSQGAPPPAFLFQAKQGSSGRHTSTTREFNSANFKLRQAEREILSQTVSVLGGLYDMLRLDAPLLYRVSHAAGTLDLLQAFVGYALSIGQCARPEVTDDLSAPIAIKAGRHPIREQILARDDSSGGFEPLDFFIGENCHFQAVTGQNGGGKSTYLQTLAQLVILAQIGCYIPAQHATVRIVSSLFARIGSTDSIEASASTFLVEMQEAAHILQAVAPDSLVLVDELGRGTAHTDGIALCWAVCEKLLELRVYTLFATHFFEICRLQASFPGFRNMHIQPVGGDGAAEGRPDAEGSVGGSVAPQRRQFLVQHMLSLEACLRRSRTRYGICTAEAAGLPRALVENARQMVKEVDRRLSTCLPDGSAAATAAEVGGKGEGESAHAHEEREEDPEARAVRTLLELAGGSAGEHSSTTSAERLWRIQQELQLSKSNGLEAAAAH